MDLFFFVSFGSLFLFFFSPVYVQSLICIMYKYFVYILPLSLTLFSHEERSYSHR